MCTYIYIYTIQEKLLESGRDHLYALGCVSVYKLIFAERNRKGERARKRYREISFSLPSHVLDPSNTALFFLGVVGGVIVNPKKLETGSRTISAGSAGIAYA